jgi:hypothetical protein
MTEAHSPESGHDMATSEPGESDDERFDVFISYSRKDSDFADRLETALERYRPPKSLGLPDRRLTVFRDVGDLVGTEYGAAIERYLTESRCLIVICSPDARASEWVNDEIRRFASARGVETIIPVLVRGRPNNEVGDGPEAAFPDALTEVLDIPLATSFQGFSGRQSVKKGQFASSWYTLLATVLGVSREQIEERDLRRRRNRNRAAGGVVAVVMASLAGLAGWALVERGQALEQSRIAQSNAFSALSTLALDRDGDHTLGFKLAAASLELDSTNPAAETLLLRSFYEGNLFRYQGRPYARPFSTDTFPSAFPEVPWDLKWISFEAGGDPSVEFIGTVAPNGSYRGAQEGGRGFVIQDAQDQEIGTIAGTWPNGAFSPGGRYVAVVSLDGEVQVAETTGIRGYGPFTWLTLSAPGGFIDDIAFSGDGETLLMSQGLGTSVRAWRLRGHPLPTVPFQVPEDASVFVDSMATRMIVAGHDVLFWSAADGLDTISAEVSALAEDGRRVVLADEAGIRVLDGQGAELARIDVEERVGSLVMLPDGRGFAAFGSNGLTLFDDDGGVMGVRAVDVGEDAELLGASAAHAIVVHGDSASIVTWSDGTRMAIAGRVDPAGISGDGWYAALRRPPDSVAVLDVRSGAVSGWKSQSEIVASRSLVYEDADEVGANVEFARITEDGAVVVAGSLDWGVFIWEWATDRIAIPSTPPYLGALDMVDSDGFLAAFDQAGEVFLFDENGDELFAINDPGGFGGRWLAGGRFLALNRPWDPEETTLLSFDTRHLMVRARADGDTLSLVERGEPAPRAELPLGDVAWAEATECGRMGLRGAARCLMERVGLAVLEDAAGVPIFLHGPHTLDSPDFSAGEHGYYNPEFVRWARETFVPDSDDLALREAIGSIWEPSVGNSVREHYAALQALDANRELKAQVLAEYPSQPDPGSYLREALGPLGEVVDARFELDAYGVPEAAGFWIRRERDGTRDEFQAAVEGLLTVYDQRFLRAAGPNAAVWREYSSGSAQAGEDSGRSIEADALMSERWTRIDDASVCEKEEAQDWVVGVRTLYCSLQRAGFIDWFIEDADMPVFLSGPHRGSELELEAPELDLEAPESDFDTPTFDFDAPTFGHYNPEFVRWAAERLIPGPDQTTARAVAGLAYRPWRRLGRAYHLALQHLEANPALEEALRAEILEGANPSMALWDALEPLRDEADRAGAGLTHRGLADGGLADDARMGEIATVAAGFWIRRDIDGSRPAFKAALLDLLSALDADFVGVP